MNSKNYHDKAFKDKILKEAGLDGYAKHYIPSYIDKIFVDLYKKKVFEKQSEKTRNQGMAKSNSMPEIKPSQEVKKVINT
jgi:hypothetical protein